MISLLIVHQYMVSVSGQASIWLAVVMGGFCIVLESLRPVI